NAIGISGSCRLAARAAPSGGAIIPAAMQGSQAVRIRTERKGETQASAQQCCTQHAIPFPALCRSQHWRGDALWMGEMQQFAAESHIFHVGNTVEAAHALEVFTFDEQRLLTGGDAAEVAAPVDQAFDQTVHETW